MLSLELLQASQVTFFDRSLMLRNGGKVSALKSSNDGLGSAHKNV